MSNSEPKQPAVNGSKGPFPAWLLKYAACPGQADQPKAKTRPEENQTQSDYAELDHFEDDLERKPDAPFAAQTNLKANADPVRLQEDDLQKQ